MKNKLTITAFMLVSMLLSGCSAPHQHEKTSWVGDTTHHWHACLGCDEILDKTEHVYGEWKTDKEATEASEGKKSRTCIDCGFKQEDKIAKLEHSHSKSTTWENDEEKHWKTCTSCNDLLDQGEHTYGEWNVIKDSTESELGLKERTCSVCSYSEQEEIALKEHNHSTGDWEKDETGHWKECSTCKNDIDFAEHTWDEGVENIIATSISGQMTYTCTTCDYQKREKVEQFYTVGQLVEKELWPNYEQFSIYARRNASSISIRLLSPNKVFTSEGRNSRVEIYFAVGENLLTREGNAGVTRINVDSSGNVTIHNYGDRIVDTSLITSKIRDDEKTIIDLDVPYSVIGAGADSIFGINCGLWSETNADWAPMMALETPNVVAVENLSQYIRCDRNNLFFECPINDYVENIPVPEYNKAELIQGYPYGIADPVNVFDENADDIYLKTSKTAEGFKFDMVGFGTFADNEHIKLIIHTSETDGQGWATQSSDVTFLISRDRAISKTGITNFWDCVDFNENDTEAVNQPVFNSDPSGYFTLSFVVDVEEIPNYSENEEVSFIALEFWGGNIYNGDPVDKAMTHEGVGVGDPALQSSYQILQEKTLTVDKETLIADYKLKFSTNYHGKITKMEEGIKLEVISFTTLNDSDFVRLIVDTDGTPVAGGWALDPKDVSFTIYSDRAYLSTGNTWFWDLENNNGMKFHNGDETINSPVFENYGEYWKLTLDIQYDELGLNIDQQSSLKGLLVLFTGNAIQNNGFNFNGLIPNDIALQSNYFTI